MFTKAKKTYREFPKTFWMLAFSSFIDLIGTFMIMPFISLYMTDKFNITLVQVGFVFTIVSIGSLVGGVFGGAVTDKFGRKKSALFGLVVSGLFSLIIIFINNLATLYIVVGIMGLVGSMGGPARQAMVADILTPKQRTEGFGILRVVMNLSATIGPALGGFLATRDFMWIFIGDAISSGITAVIFLVKIPETKPKIVKKPKLEKIVIKNGEIKTDKRSDVQNSKGMGSTLKGYKDVFADWRFMLFVLISMIMSFVYMNLHSTLPIFIRDNLGYTAQIYGWLISLNAFMVVVLQFWITRKIKALPALVMMAIGNLLYGIGFGMHALISSIPMLILAMVVITIGEMIVSPFSQAIAANIAPEDKRGRYMAIFSWSGLVPGMFGVLVAGAVMENNPAFLWYLTGILSIITAGGYLLLQKFSRDHFDQKEEEEKICQNINKKKLHELSTLEKDDGSSDMLKTQI